MKTKFICFCPNSGAVRAFIDTEKFNYMEMPPNEELIEIIEECLLNFIGNLEHTPEQRPRLLERAWEAMQNQSWKVDLDTQTLIRIGE